MRHVVTNYVDIEYYRKRVTAKEFAIGVKVSAIKFTPEGPKPNEEAIGLIEILQVNREQT